MIILPWFHLEHRAPKCLEILERFRHRTVRTRHAFLPRHTRNTPGLDKPMHTRLDRTHPRIMRRHPHAARHVRAHADPGPTEREQRSLAPRGSPRAEPHPVRVHRPPKHVVGGLEREHRRRHVSLDERHRTRVAQQPHQRTVVQRRVPREARVPDARVGAAHGDRVLEGHGYACERAAWGGGCRREQDLGEAVGLGVRVQGALGVGGEHVGWVEGGGLDGGDDGGDGAGENVHVVRRQGLMVGLWEGCDARCTLALLVMAARR